MFSQILRQCIRTSVFPKCIVLTNTKDRQLLVNEYSFKVLKHTLILCYNCVLHKCFVLALWFRVWTVLLWTVDAVQAGGISTQTWLAACFLFKVSCRWMELETC